MGCNGTLYVTNGNEGKVPFICQSHQTVPARYSSEENESEDEPTQAVASDMESKSLLKEDLEKKLVE